MKKSNKRESILDVLSFGGQLADIDVSGTDQYGNTRSSTVGEMMGQSTDSDAVGGYGSDPYSSSGEGENDGSDGGAW